MNTKITNPFVLKTIVWDEEDQRFCSPDRKSFVWGTDIVKSICTQDPKCPDDDIRDECTCGLYGSPNWQAINEYFRYPNSVMALMKCYNVLNIWTAPWDIPNCYVTRTWGMRVAHIVKPDVMKDRGNMAQRYTSAVWAADYYNARVLDLAVINQIIKISWNEVCKIDPFAKLEGDKNG